MAAGADRRGCQGAVRPSAGRRRRRPGPGVLAGEVAQIPGETQALFITDSVGCERTGWWLGRGGQCGEQQWVLGRQ